MRKSYPFIDCCIKTISKMKLSKGQETKITQKITNYFISKHSGIIHLGAPAGWETGQVISRL